MGRKETLRYHIFQHGWNAYLRTISIDYKSAFTCPTSKDNPEIIILDGITMGTIREIYDVFSGIDPNQYIPLVPLATRTLIAEPEVRKLLAEFSYNGLDKEQFNEWFVSK